MNDPYQTLNVPRDASGEEIKRAYRERAKATHPDRATAGSGDEEAFKEVAAAYALLSDPQAREHYDRTGTAPQTEPRISPAEQLILSTLNSHVIATGDLEDVLGTLGKALKRQLETHRENLEAGVEGERAAREQLGRFRLRNEGSPDCNLLEGAFQNLVNNALRVQERELEAIRTLEEALKLLEGYEDTRQPAPAAEPDPWCGTFMGYSKRARGW